MASRYQTVTLAREHHAQLHRLAEHFATTPRAVLATLIDRELAALGLDRSIPGFEIAYAVAPEGSRLIVDIDAFRVTVTPRVAAGWADAIASAVELRGGGGTVDDGAALFADRQGNGIVLSGLADGRASFKLTYSVDVARAIARELHEAVAELPAA